jgi:hypothetical protein
VNLRIDAIYIAGGSLCAVLPALKYENAVSAICDVRPIKSKTEFYRHVEPRNAAGHFDARQVVDRELGLFDQFDDRAEPALIRDGEGGLDPEPELRQTDNIGQVKRCRGEC